MSDNPIAHKLDDFLVDDAMNLLVLHKATRDHLIERGNQMALAMRDAHDEIVRLQALVDNAGETGDET